MKWRLFVSLNAFSVTEVAPISSRIFKKRMSNGVLDLGFVMSPSRV